MDWCRPKELRRLNYLMGETDAAYHEAALRLGLSDSAMRILYTVCDYSDGFRCPLREVCRRCGLSKQTVNSALRKLEAEGIIFLEAEGAKSKTVCLTTEGRGLAERTVMRLMAAENQVLGGWSREDVEKYLELAERFLAAFQEKAKEL